MGKKESAVPLRYRNGHFTWKYVRPSTAALWVKSRRVKVNHQVEDWPANDRIFCFHKHVLRKVEVSKLFVSRRVLKTWKNYMYAVLYVLNKESVGKRKRMALWDCGFESRRGHGCLFLANVVWGEVEAFATVRSLVQRSPYRVSLNVIRCNNNPLRLQGVGRRGQRNKEIRTTVLLSLITGTRQWKPVVFAVTFALFYKLVSVHSGFDWKSVSNSDQKTLLFSVFLDNCRLFQPRISWICNLCWIRTTAEAEIIVIIGRWESRVISCFCFSLLLFHNIRSAYSSSWLNMPKYNVKVWWFADSVPSTVTVMVFQH
jgi:hypothetical protein